MAKTLSLLTRCRLFRDGVLSILRLPSAFRRHNATVPKLPLFKSFSNSYTSQNLRPLRSQTSCSRKSRFWGDGGFCFGCEGAQPILTPRVRRLRAALRQRFGRCRPCKMRLTKHCEVQPRTCAARVPMVRGVRVATGRRPPRRLVRAWMVLPARASRACQQRPAPRRPFLFPCPWQAPDPCGTPPQRAEPSTRSILAPDRLAKTATAKRDCKIEQGCSSLSENVTL